MQLNKGQQEAALAVYQFLFSNDKEFIISGPAGVGKTFLMHHIMNNLISEYEDGCKLLGITPVHYDVALTATTNKATEVLAESTGFPASTIHSFMNLKVVDNFKTGVSEITPTNAFRVHRETLIFIDEASMIDSKLLKFIHEGTDSTCKIIYLGDHCQMAPVFEKISPVYRNPKNFALLTEPVRNAEQPALMDICNQLRLTVETLQFQKLEPIPGVIDYVSDQEAAEFINETFQAENPDARILCYTNNRVQEYNQYIRNLRGYPSTFIEGEMLISNSSTQVGKTRFNVEQALEVTEVLSAPYPHKIDATDPNAQFDVYKLELRCPRTQERFVVKVPVDHAHYKALMRHYANQRDWSTYYSLKNNFPDLRQKDAATVYKAQGSTYDTVFLDLQNIGKCTQEDQLARMLYVGASRPRRRLVLYGDLPKRLFRAAAA